jgi:hypothetical protein
MISSQLFNISKILKKIINIVNYKSNVNDIYMNNIQNTKGKNVKNNFLIQLDLILDLYSS